MSGAPPLEVATDAEDLARAIAEVREKVATTHRDWRDQVPYWVLFGPGTADYPGLYVARLWFMRPEPRLTNMLVRAGTLDTLRYMMPDAATCYGRGSGDDPNILEVWM